MFLKFDRWVFIKPLFNFDQDDHKRAFVKFVALWTMSSLPIFIAAALKPRVIEHTTGNEGFLPILYGYFGATEQFIYAAAFLPPLIYLFFDRYFEASLEAEAKDKFAMTVRKVFDGYFPVLIVAIIVFLMTIITYVGTKTDV